VDTGPRGRHGPEVQLSRRLPRLFLVTNEEVVGRTDFPKMATSAVTAGGRDCVLQLRAHGLKGGRFWELAVQGRQMTWEAGASLWVNDRVDVALATRADGVQLGARSMSPAQARALLGQTCLIGCSVHSGEEATAALDEGADVAVLGNVYATASHPERQPLGLAALREAAGCGRPIVAIGGITVERVKEVLEAGACGVAVLSGVWQARDAGKAVRDYVAALQEARGGAEVRGLDAGG
jgi:thiamine-phosphate diphosphorylase